MDTRWAIKSMLLENVNFRELITVQDDSLNGMSP